MVVIGLLLIGLISQTAYLYARRTRSLRHCLLAGYFLYLALFGFYANLWTQADWLMVAPMLWLCGRMAENQTAFDTAGFEAAMKPGARTRHVQPASDRAEAAHVATPARLARVAVVCVAIATRLPLPARTDPSAKLGAAEKRPRRFPSSAVRGTGV